MIQQSLTPAQFTAAKAKVLAQSGIDLQGDSGTVTHEGITIAYSYDGAALLSIDIKHKPFFMPQTLIESKIKSWFSEK